MNAATSRTVILCADDFGLAPGVSDAIIELVEDGRISATSCMMVCEGIQLHAPRLMTHLDKVDVGLHLTLTDLAPLGAMAQLAPVGRLPEFKTLMAAAYRRRLPMDEIEAELSRQFESFIALFGRPPDFIDGHHHVHQLPGVRDAVVELALRRMPQDGRFVRCCHESLLTMAWRGVAIGKAFAIGAPGAGLRRVARRKGVAVNQGFSGLYDFGGGRPYGQLFPKFLRGARTGTLIVCHPGMVDDELRAVDSLTGPREAEYRYLKGDAFPRLMAERNVNLGRFAKCVGPVVRAGDVRDGVA